MKDICPACEKKLAGRLCRCRLVVGDAESDLDGLLVQPSAAGKLTRPALLVTNDVAME